MHIQVLADAKANGAKSSLAQTEIRDAALNSQPRFRKHQAARTS
jgi:hypothetical protein